MAASMYSSGATSGSVVGARTNVFTCVLGMLKRVGARLSVRLRGMSRRRGAARYNPVNTIGGEGFMEYRNLGQSGLRVSAVGIGCNNFVHRCDLEQTRTVIHKALDLGITLFDTA